MTQRLTLKKIIICEQAIKLKYWQKKGSERFALRAFFDT